MELEAEDQIEPVDNVRDDLEKAFAEHEEKEPEEADKVPVEVKSDRARDDAGKFAKKAEPEIDKPVEIKPAPKSWKAEEKALWEKMTPEARAIVERREAEVERGFTQLDEDRNFGKSMKEIVAPYMATIQAEGGTPQTAVQSLLNTAFYLRSNATPQEKGKLILNLAKQFNADISNTAPVQPDDLLAQTQRELAQLREEVQKQPKVFQQQQEETLIQRTLAAFAADPKNAHYEKLKPIMASLLQGGQAKDLQEAYDKACWADPEIRSAKMADDKQSAEEKRIAEAKAKTVTARKTAVSVKGSPGIVPNANGKDTGSVRDSLLAAWDEHAA